MFKKYFYLLVISNFLTFITGCQTLDEALFGKTLVIRMKIKSESNKNMAFENDIVASSSPEFGKKIEQTSNKDWFDESNTEFQEIKKSKYVKVYKTYIIPTESKKMVTVNIPKNCKYIYIFNRYSSQENAFPIKVNSESNIRMLFDKLKIEVKEIDPKSNELEATIKEDDNA